MKKRIFMLALVVGVLLSFSASAWADDPNSIKLDTIASGYTTVYVDNDRISSGKTFTIAVKASILSASDSNIYVNDATHIQWKVTQVADTDGGTEPVGDLAITAANSALSSRTNNTVDYEALTDSKTTATLSANLTGKIQAAGTVTITATLVKNTNGDAATNAISTNAISNGTATATVTFSTSATADVKTTDSDLFSDSTDNPDLYDTYDPRDPDSVEWDGLDPTFSNTISGDTGPNTVYGKNKPKLGSIDKNKLTFTPGTADTLTVTMTGPITLVDVYIAQKDAKKLYPASADSINADIRLTSASIKAYRIPFRVTAYSLDSADKSGSSAKEVQKAWKDAKNSLTIAYNGAKVQLKGFPITISMSNSNNTEKPTKKAIKLNVGTTFTEPVWTYEVESKEVTADEDTYTAWQEDSDTARSGVESYAHVYDEEVSTAVMYTPEGEENEINVIKDMVDQWLGITTTAGVAFQSGDSIYYVVNGDNEYVYTTVQQEASWYRYVNVAKELGKKDKPELSTWVNPDGADGAKAGEISGTYTVSGDVAPYAITIKPNDDTKLRKFFDTGYEVVATQPTYNYLGEVEENGHGYVTIKGQPTVTNKESKLALTLTAQNASTKKKAAAKVTAIGKTKPVMDKVTKVKVTDAEYSAWDYDTEGYSYPYGATDEEYKRVTTKAVEAGKTPSVKFKAKGSKTIAYKLGKYVVNEETNNELQEEEGYEDFNAALATALTAHKLSFDEKKGAVVLASRTDKATLPTLNEDRDAFKSLDIVVTAYNSVGADQAWGAVQITGAKPKMSDKSVEISGTVKKGDTFTFKVLAGKDAAEGKMDGSANVKVYAADSTATTALSNLGLALVTYDSMDVLTSAEVTVAADGILPESFNETTDLVSGTVREASTEDGSTEISGRKYAQVEVVIRSGDTWVKSADTSLKNYGILQVVNPATLAGKSSDKTANKGVSVNLTLENLGATNKGKIKVVIKNDVVDGGDPANPTTATATAATATGTAAAKANVKSGHGYAPADETALEAEEAEETTEAEAKVTFGPARTADSLSAAQQAFLADNGYTVVAVLPEATAEADGQYDFEVVDLNENAPEGAKLVWLAFPKDGSYSEDDEIADFYDEAGAPIENVPASLKVKVSAWLRAGVTYEPVIAVKD